MACFTPPERQSFSNFLRMGFTDSFRYQYPGKIKYSFWDIRDKSRKENKGWRLDYVLISKWLEKNIKDSEIHGEYWGSDHCPVSLTIDVENIDLKGFQEQIRCYPDGDKGSDDEERKSELDMEDNLDENGVPKSQEEAGS
jgi:hypothetical protein